MLEVLKRMLGHAQSSDKASEPQLATDLSLACITHTGYHRVHNEDNFLFLGQMMPQEHQSLDEPLSATVQLSDTVLVAVLDGMGGELAGEAASFTAASALSQVQGKVEPDEQNLHRAFDRMQKAVSDLRLNWKLSSVGTTATVLVARDSHALVGNLGDSPAYLFRDAQLTTISKAHTDAALLAKLGIDRKPSLTQYLGMDESDAPIEPQLAPITLQVGDRILLASDGLTDMVSLPSIANAMTHATNPTRLAVDLCNKALDAGGVDNITILACEAR